MDEHLHIGSSHTRWLDRSATLRVAVVEATHVARALCALHDLEGGTAADLAMAVVGGVLLASDLKSEQTLSLQIELERSVHHVDATSDGLVRAMVTERSHVASVGRVAARRFGRSGLLYQSVVDVASSTVAGLLEGFLEQSEQQRVRLDLACPLDGSGLPGSARGALVRGFPATPHEELDALFEAWTRRGEWTWDAPCRDLGGWTWDRLSTHEVRHYCPCSRERAQASIQALGAEALSDAARKGEPLEVVCDFCRSAYVFEPDEFRPTPGA